MKIRNYLTILFAVLAIAALLGLAGFMTVYTADNNNPVRQQLMEILHLEEKPASGSVLADPLQTDIVSSDDIISAHQVVFVGDSRTVGMGNAVNDACTYIGESGEGYHWLVSTGTGQLAAVLESNPSLPVILNFGVNDPENVSLYIDCYRSLMQTYPNTPFYLLSVNPLSDEADFNTSNEMVEAFNSDIKDAFPDQYLDCYSYLIENGFQTVDGLHYTEETYQIIHDFAVRQSAQS